MGLTTWLSTRSLSTEEKISFAFFAPCLRIDSSANQDRWPFIIGPEGALEFPCTFCRHHCCSSSADRLTFDEGRCKRSRSALGKHIPRLEGLAHIYPLTYKIFRENYILKDKFDLITTCWFGFSLWIGGPFCSRVKAPLRFRLLILLGRRHGIDFLAILYLQLGAVSHILP